MIAHPGKKLMFMGSEIGQADEWNSNEGLQWNLLEREENAKLNLFFKTINKLYRLTPALYENDYNWKGFQWIRHDDRANSIIAFRRIALNGDEIICVCNFQPVTRGKYRIGVPTSGAYKEVFNFDSTDFGGSGICNTGTIIAEDIEQDYLDFSIEITVPPLGVTFYKLCKEQKTQQQGDKTP